MKKLIFSICFVLTSIVVNAQGIYTKVTKYDKFDDVEWEKTIKTLITKTDTTFVIETKGSKPKTYWYIDGPFFSAHEGSRDSLSNIVADVWGYESQYIVITEETIEEVRSEVREQIKDLPDSLVFDEKINKLSGLALLRKIDKLPKITVRTISKYRFTYEYDTDLVWIRFEDGSRIIYSKR